MQSEDQIWTPERQIMVWNDVKVNGCLTYFLPSGAEDKHGYIWDRHYNICLARLAHDDVVNSVAFSPADQELLLSASDDSTIKVWRSPRMVRLAQTPARPPRPRKLLSSWMNRNRNATSANSVNGKPWVGLENTWGREREEEFCFICFLYGVKLHSRYAYRVGTVHGSFSHSHDPWQCWVSSASRALDVMWLRVRCKGALLQ